MRDTTDQYTVHFGTGATLTMELIDGTDPIDLAPYASALLRSAPAPASNGPQSDFAVLVTTGDLRFFHNGRRIATHAGLARIAAGVVAALQRFVDTHRPCADERQQ